MGNWLPLCEQLQSNSWWGRKASLIHSPALVFGNYWSKVFRTRFASLSLSPHPSSVSLLQMWRSQRARSETITVIMFNETAPCWLRTLKRSWERGSHKQTAGYCFQMSCNTSPPPRAVQCLLFLFLLLCFSQYSVACFSESGIRLVCNICLFMAAVQRKTSEVTSLLLFLSFFFISKPFQMFFLFFFCSFTFSFCPVSPIPADPNRTNYFECSCRN